MWAFFHPLCEGKATWQNQKRYTVLNATVELVRGMDGLK